MASASKTLLPWLPEPTAQILERNHPYGLLKRGHARLALMTTPSAVSNSISELEFLLTRRTISLSTRRHLKEFITELNDYSLVCLRRGARRADGSEWQVDWRLYGSEQTLKWHLTRDRENEVLLLAFRGLIARTLRLRYLWHHKKQEHVINNSVEVEMVNWDRVWANIEPEIAAVRDYEFWHRYSNPPVQVLTPLLDLREQVGNMCRMTRDETIHYLQYRESVTSETSILEAHRVSGDQIWTAQILATDRRVLQIGVLDIEHKQSVDEILDALDEYQKMYFNEISTQEDSPGWPPWKGDSKLWRYHLTDEENERIQRVFKRQMEEERTKALLLRSRSEARRS